MIVRPPEYLDDVHERELEIQAAEARLAEIGVPRCARTATTRSRRTSCAARTACASSRTRAQPAAAARPDLEDLPVLRDRVAAGPRPAASQRRSRSSAAPAQQTTAARRRRPDLTSPAERCDLDRALASARTTRPIKETAPAMERTLILVKPDAFARNLTGEIIARFERKGLRLAALQLMTMTRETGRAPLRRARRQAVLRRACRRSSPPARWSRWCSRASPPSRPRAR